MAEPRPKVVLYPPGGIGLRSALDQTASMGSLVSALEDQTLWTAKRLLADKAEDVDFKSFGDLLGWVARMAGLVTNRRSSPSQLRAMVMRAAQSLPQTSLLSSAAEYTGTSQAIGQTLTTLHYHRVTTSDLREAAKSAAQPTADKLKDLAELEGLVRAQMGVTNQEFGVERAFNCLQTSLDSVQPVPKLVVVMGCDRSPIYETWLLWLAAQGVDLHLLIEQNGPDSAEFVPQAQTLQNLNATVTKTAKAPLWTNVLFTDKTTDQAPAVQIHKCPDPLNECETALRRCQKALKDGGTFDSMGIFVRDLDKYAPLLLATSKRLGVPIALRTGLPLLANGFATHVLSVLKAFASGDVRRFGSCVSSTYFGLDQDQASSVAALCRESFNDPDPWSALADRIKAQDNLESVTGALEWRDEFALEPATVRTWKQALVALCTKTPFLDHMVESKLTVSRDTRSQSLMQRSLDDAVLECGESLFTLQQFVDKATGLWELERVAWSNVDDDPGRQIPEAVRVCSSTRQLLDFDLLVVMGMLEGVMPRRRSEDPVLSDQELDFISEAVPSADRLPTSHSQAAAERDEFVRLCGSARRDLVFSYPETQDDKDNIPAFYLEEVIRAVGLPADTRPVPTEVVPQAKDCVLDADLALRHALDAPVEPFQTPALATEAARALAIPGPDHLFTTRELAAAVACPFKSFASGRLGLYSRSQRTFLSDLRRVPEKAGLLRIEDRTDAVSALELELDEAVQNRANRLRPWERHLLEKGASRLRNQWVEREFESRRLHRLPRQEIQTPGHLGDPKDGFEWTIQGRTIRIKDKIAAKLLDPTLAVGIDYASSPPDIKPYNAFTESLEDTVEIGLVLLGLMRDRPDACLVIEGLEGRALYIVYDPQAIRANVRADGFSTHWLVQARDSSSDAKREFFQNLKEKILEGLSHLDQGDVSPTPGLPCNKCRYGDLCRRHIQNGETNQTVEGVEE